MTDLYNGSLTDLFRNDARYDPEVQSFAYALLMEKRRLMNFAKGTRPMVAIDDLPESTLDLLACDFKVDWWDASATVDKKRTVLQTAWRIHSFKGTKAAVETAVSAIVPEATVKEWFEYGGSPYHFHLCVDVSDSGVLTDDKIAALRNQVDYYKNARSWYDGIRYTSAATNAELRCATVIPRSYMRAKAAAPSNFADVFGIDETRMNPGDSYVYVGARRSWIFAKSDAEEEDTS